MGGCIGGWVYGWFGHSFDILTFEFLLKTPQPATGLFFDLAISAHFHSTILGSSHVTRYHSKGVVGIGCKN